MPQSHKIKVGPTAEEKAIAHFQARPEDYFREIIGVEPEPHQIKVARAVAEQNARVSFVGANGAGKDALCAWLVEWFLYCHEGIIPTTSASDRQIGLLWHEINLWTGKSKARPAFELLQRKMYKKSNPSAYAEGFKAASAAKMEGYHAQTMLYIMTEAKGVEDWGYQAVLKACTREDNRILIQSVPGDETGEFYAIAAGKRPKWKVFTVPVARKVRTGPDQYEYEPTTRLVTKESIDEKLAYGEASSWFTGPVLAEFNTAGSTFLISLAMFNRAANRWEEIKDEPESGQDILGVDVAWTGANETVLCHRKGQKVQRMIAYGGQRTDVTADRVIEWMVAFPGGAVVIENGIAQSGVIDRIVSQGDPNRMFLVLPGGPAMEQEKFFNRRCELYYYLMKRFEDGSLAIAPEYRQSPLGGQLTSIKKVIRGDSKWEVESKKSMMARRVPSPDWADALMLSMGVSDAELVESVREGATELSQLWSGGQRTTYLE